MAMMTDSSAELDALVERTRTGDAQAFDDLVRRIERPLRACIGAHAAHAHQIEEILQETLVTIFRRLDQYREEGAFLAWSKAIARNHLRMEHRATRRLTRSGDGLDAILISAQVDRLEQAEEAAAAEAAVERLGQCMEHLEPGLRRLVEQHHCEGIGLGDLARQLGQTVNWLAVKLFRVRQSLQTCMERGPRAAR
jgi:RNA polymerase sigma-70 factor, ECF subfamily